MLYFIGIVHVFQSSEAQVEDILVKCFRHVSMFWFMFLDRDVNLGCQGKERGKIKYINDAGRYM